MWTPFISPLVLSYLVIPFVVVNAAYIRKCLVVISLNLYQLLVSTQLWNNFKLICVCMGNVAKVTLGSHILFSELLYETSTIANLIPDHL